MTSASPSRPSASCRDPAAYVAVLNQTKRLRQQHGLQPVQDKALNFTLDDDRRLADGLVNRLGLRDDLRCRPRRADELHERDEMRWVDRMGDEAAMASLEVLREQARHDGRGGGSENGLGRGKPVEFGKDRALGLDALGQA